MWTYSRPVSTAGTAVSVAVKASMPPSRSSKVLTWPATLTGMVRVLPPAETVRVPLALFSPAVKRPFSSTVPTAGSAVQVKQVSWAVRSRPR